MPLVLLMCAAAGPVGAQTLPSPWRSADVGAPTLAGSATHASGVFTVEGGGHGLGGPGTGTATDQAHVVYQQISGDVEVVARVDSLTSFGVWTEAGVTIRSSLSANAAHATAEITTGRGVQFVRRASNGAASLNTAGPSSAQAPMWVRLVRSGTTVTAYYSADGAGWTAIGSQTIALGTSAYVGLSVSSHNASYRTTARVTNVQITGQGLPNGQQAADIGQPAQAGGTTYSSGTYTVRAGGADIWDVADQFHFVYQPITGNAEVIVRVASVTNTDSWAKAGVMIRESLSAQSRHAMVVLSAGRGYAFQRRQEPGAQSVHTAGPAVAAPGWVRLVRTGDRFDAYSSSNGTSWTSIGSDTILMQDTVYVGLAATSHNTAALSTATLTNFRLTASAAGNQAPAVSITAPSTGTQVNAGAAVSLAASATDPESRMASVDFYVGSTQIVRDTTAPYAATWTASTAGTYALTAVAHDQDGNSTTSSAVSVTVNSGSNQAPSVSLTGPTSGATFTAPAAMTLTATASDPEGQLARVEFFSGSTRLATDTSAPYSYSWSNVPAGNYSLTAVAYDAQGAGRTSAAVTVTVNSPTNQAPSVSLTSPTAGSSFAAPASITIAASASDPEGQLARVEFFSGSTRLATDTTAPYSYSWANVPAGTYSVTAVAFDAQGASRTSAAVSVTVASSTTTPRQVVFTAPSDHATSSVTSYTLRVFASTANPDTATPVATSDLGKPNPASNGDITVDRATFFSGLAAGSYIATVTAVGPGGQTQSASVAFTR